MLLPESSLPTRDPWLRSAALCSDGRRASIFPLARDLRRIPCRKSPSYLCHHPGGLFGSLPAELRGMNTGSVAPCPRPVHSPSAQRWEVTFLVPKSPLHPNVAETQTRSHRQRQGTSRS